MWGGERKQASGGEQAASLVGRYREVCGGGVLGTGRKGQSWETGGGGGGDAGYTGRVADESMGEERREVKEGREEEEPEGLLACF